MSDSKLFSEGDALRVAVVGAGKITQGQHVPAIGRARGVRLAAVCDLNADLVMQRASEWNVPGYTDLARMMAEVKPDIVTIGTDDRTHARLTVLAARAGARAVHCEKPMAVHPKDAREMVAVCAQTGTLLTINHQRRMGDVGAARRAIEAGCIGEVLELEGFCAGDLLGDGTHTIDALLCLAGDPPVEEVLGALDLSAVKERYGHPAESGSRLEVRIGNERQMTVATGSFAQRHAYQEYRVLGSKGSLWRAGDLLNPKWFINDGGPGTHAPLFDRKKWFSYPQPVEGGGRWRPLDGAEFDPGVGACAAAYEQIVQSLRSGVAHPLDGRRTLTVQNVITAGYLSGLRRAPVKIGEVDAIDEFPLHLNAAVGS